MRIHLVAISIILCVACGPASMGTDAGMTAGTDAGMTAGTDAGMDAGTDGGSTGSVTCSEQACTGDGGCCAGAYCWGFSNICLQDGVCPGAGITTPMPGLCSCDGFPATPCPTGQTCPTPVHGHATFCH